MTKAKQRGARHHDDVRRRILQTAERLFVDRGVENVSMRKIARRIEYSPTLIYRYFRNKEAIIQELIQRGYRQVYENYTKILDNRPESPPETLRQILTMYIDFAVSHPDHYKLWYHTSRLEWSGRMLVMAHGEIRFQVYQTWLDRIDECRAEGLFPGRETLQVFQVIWGLVHGLVSLRIHHKAFPWMPLDQHVGELLGMLDRCVTQPPPAEDRATASRRLPARTTTTCHTRDSSGHSVRRRNT